jgi:phosphatidylethanolamine/phosphatidyl-N-methylethanolamine N-methyltransferase
MAVAPARPHESKIYYEFSHLYDRIFTRVFFPRIESTLRSLDMAPGAKILEVGVGTGLSLSAYPSHTDVVGIDLARDMLDRAQEKIDENGWTHIRLETGDALNLSFPDGSFDFVTSFHVVSVVPDSARMMREIARVCRPGGIVVIINHFRSERRWLAQIVDRFDPMTRKLGWRTTLSFAELLSDVDLELVRRFKTSPSSLFTVVIARKRVAASAVNH